MRPGITITSLYKLLTGEPNQPPKGGCVPAGPISTTLGGVAQIWRIAHKPKSGTQNHRLDERGLGPARTHLDPPEGLVQILPNRAGNPLHIEDLTTLIYRLLSFLKLVAWPANKSETSMKEG